MNIIIAFVYIYKSSVTIIMTHQGRIMYVKFIRDGQRESVWDLLGKCIRTLT